MRQYAIDSKKSLRTAITELLDENLTLKRDNEKLCQATADKQKVQAEQHSVAIRQHQPHGKQQSGPGSLQVEAQLQSALTQKHTAELQNRQLVRMLRSMLLCIASCLQRAQQYAWANCAS